MKNNKIEMTSLFWFSILAIVLLPTLAAAQEEPQSIEATGPSAVQLPADETPPAQEPEPQPEAVTPSDPVEEPETIAIEQEEEHQPLMDGIDEAAGDSKPSRYFKLTGKLQTLFFYQNDYDFDGTDPIYNEDGQSVGLLGTFFKPRLEITPVEELKLVYELEIGLNLWGRNDPDQYLNGSTDAFRLAHRELYAEGRFVDGLVGFKVGYQHFSDPTGLFLNHWIGAASFISDPGWAKFTLSAAQLPDQSAEGIELNNNNFRHDTFAYGLRIDVPVDAWAFNIGLYGLHDSRVVDQTMNLFAPSMRIAGDYDFFLVGIDLAMQYGNTDNAAIGGDEETLAFAAQANLQFKTQSLTIALNQLFLSADDDKDRNDSNHAFFYSGKNRSRTILLSEDEIRDRSDNLDERIAESRGKFKLARPGYSLTDLSVAYAVTDYFIPALVLGVGAVPESANAAGNSFVGVEADLDLHFRYKQWLAFHAIYALLAPGQAAAAFVNQYDASSTNLQHALELSLEVYF